MVVFLNSRSFLMLVIEEYHVVAAQCNLFCPIVPRFRVFLMKVLKILPYRLVASGYIA